MHTGAFCAQIRANGARSFPPNSAPVTCPDPSLAVWGSGVRVPSAPPGFPGVVGRSRRAGRLVATISYVNGTLRAHCVGWSCSASRPRHRGPLDGLVSQYLRGWLVSAALQGTAGTRACRINGARHEALLLRVLHRLAVAADWVKSAAAGSGDRPGRWEIGAAGSRVRPRGWVSRRVEPPLPGGFRSTILGWRCYRRRCGTASTRRTSSTHSCTPWLSTRSARIRSAIWCSARIGPRTCSNWWCWIARMGRLSSMRCRCGTSTDDYCREAGEGYGGQAEGERGRA